MIDKLVSHLFDDLTEVRSGSGFCPDPDPDFVPLRIRTQEKSLIGIRTKGSGPETLVYRI